ncbi:MAG: PorT family protein [Bacteroidaceae bacterium]|nr:PorT family protein [Bacteroidaceae bacterium]
MKKLVVVLMMALLMVSPANAQVRLGIKGGMNLSKLTFDKDVVSSENRAGFFVGPIFYVDLPFLPGFGFDLAAIYDRKGTTMTAVIDDQKYEKKGYVQFLDVPIDVNYKISFTRGFAIYGSTGPQFSFNLKQDDFKTIVDQRANYKIKDSNFSWNVGFGMEIIRHFRLGYNYNIALGDWAEVKEDLTETVYQGLKNDKMKGSSHQVYLVYIF